MEQTREDHILDYSGAFRLLRKVADGGMATVYEAEQLGPAGFAKRVALKVIHPQYASERHWLQLFIDEAKLSANLAHGNIVQIYQLGEVDGQYYMAMEYIQGPTLRSIIDRHAELRQPMPLPIAAYIASRVCRALDYAHNFVAPGGQRLDVVHRDVSPGNIMATWDGHIKLADFGIAKARTSVDPAERHILMGKKHYMSPEQALALAVDARSDVFTLGVVLYEVLTLEPLFKEDITDLLLDEVTVHPLPSVRSRVPQLPREIDDVLTRALSRDPNRRPTAAAMGHALDGWIEKQRPVASPDRLQEHLTTLFPSSQKRTSGSSNRTETPTRFSNFKRGLRRPRKPGFLSRLFGL
jgi:serine/threonine protein kinase